MDLSYNANTSTVGTRLFSLPLEIRLLIYKQLLVQSGHLLRTFCTCRFCANRENPAIGRECLNPSLLRTNKAIHHEALPILYSMNVFSFFCYGPFPSPNPFYERRSVVGPIANRHSPWAGVARIIACPNDAAKPHVKKIFLNLDRVYHKMLDYFPDHWWYLVEKDVLQLFPGVDQIEIRIGAKQMPIMAGYLVFRRKDLMAAYKQDYKSLLADEASLMNPTAPCQECLRYIEALYDAVIAAQTQGEMKNCRFGLENVSGTYDHRMSARPKAMMLLCTSIQLGCHSR